ncbi:hypothetical protein SAMN05192561_10384 [Halopenitus malekzadehii]|uniref:CARDB protein n=1 Tax=Halopenitus malekzadehii TaxID=1267564 RepID=A0A1H6IPT6_9EURY|nr:hypothetical protein [Halopenitus malekzadehii]SEH49504.1 hypothetical protein SAMN05192561_10384 [Halopenitus malekzadehii]
MDPTRRRVLVGIALPAIASVGGCLGDVLSDGGGNGIDPSVTGTSTGTDDGKPTDGPDTPGGSDATGVTVHDLTVRPELVAMDSPDSYGVYGGRGSQYVVADVAVEDPTSSPPDSFALETPAETFPATTGIGPSPGTLVDFGEAYGWPEPDPAERGWVAVPVPNPIPAASDARLVWGTDDGTGEGDGDGSAGAHVLAADTTAALERGPTDFAVSVDAPDAITLGETVTATIAVENVGDVDGTFVAAINRIGPRIAYAPEAAVSLSVPAGETATHTYEHAVTDPEIAEQEGPTLRLRIHWRDGDRSHDVAIRTGE